jgi:hypothetical protein
MAHYFSKLGKHVENYDPIAIVSIHPIMNSLEKYGEELTRN